MLRSSRVVHRRHTCSLYTGELEVMDVRFVDLKSATVVLCKDTRRKSTEELGAVGVLVVEESWIMFGYTLVEVSWRVCSVE